MCLLVYTLMCSQVCYVFVTNGIFIFLNKTVNWFYTSCLLRSRTSLRALVYEGQSLLTQKLVRYALTNLLSKLVNYKVS